MMDEVMALYNILDCHCIFDPERDCTNREGLDCIYCLARYLVQQGVTVKGVEHGA